MLVDIVPMFPTPPATVIVAAPRVLAIVIVDDSDIIFPPALIPTLELGTFPLAIRLVPIPAAT